MKKFFAIILCVMVIAAAAAGCSDRRNDGNAQTFDPDAYKAPAEAVSVDTGAEDPSNDEIRFVYDEEGRISQCYYEIGGVQVFVNYDYKDSSVQIYAFMGEFLAADEAIELPEYDASVGFTVVNGYYLKGYKF